MKQSAFVVLAALGLLGAAGPPRADSQEPPRPGEQIAQAASDSAVYRVTSSRLRSSFEGGSASYTSRGAFGSITPRRR